MLMLKLCDHVTGLEMNHGSSFCVFYCSICDFSKHGGMDLMGS